MSSSLETLMNLNNYYGINNKPKDKPKYNPGDFSFVKDELFIEALTHDYQCMTDDDWKQLKSHNPDKSFLWETNGPKWEMIKNKMWNGHSGASMAISLRQMESIAKNGWENYVTSYLKK